MKNLVWGKMKKLTVPAIKSHKDSNKVLPLRLARTPNISHKNQEPPGPHTLTHNDEKIALVLALASGFAIWNIFR